METQDSCPFRPLPRYQQNRPPASKDRLGLHATKRELESLSYLSLYGSVDADDGVYSGDAQVPQLQLGVHRYAAEHL